MANAVANHIKYLLSIGSVNFSSDQFKIMLMEAGFVFNRDAHEAYADVSAHELADGNGYTVGGEILVNVAVNEDDADDRTEVTWDNKSWVASGGTIGPTSGAIIYDVTAGNAIVGFIDFGTEYLQAEGGTATVANIEVRVS